MSFKVIRFLQARSSICWINWINQDCHTTLLLQSKCISGCLKSHTNTDARTHAHRLATEAEKGSCLLINMKNLTLQYSVIPLGGALLSFKFLSTLPREQNEGVFPLKVTTTHKICSRVLLFFKYIHSQYRKRD